MILFGQLSMSLRTHMPISSNVRRADLMQTFPEGMAYKGFDCTYTTVDYILPMQSQ